MGLDATVYRCGRNLPDSVRGLTFELDPETGEPVLQDQDDHLLREFVACHRRLTNVGGAGMLHAELAKLGTPADSLLLARVLFSGSHCGDDIPLDEVPRLQAEIAAVSPRAQERVAEFLQDMSDLCTAAIAEGNAITF